MARYIKFPVNNDGEAIVDLSTIATIYRYTNTLTIHYTTCGNCRYEFNTTEDAEIVFNRIWVNLAL